MAKVGKKLQNKQQVNLWLRHQVTIRKPNYKQDLENLIEEDKSLMKKMEGIAQKYKNPNKNSIYNRLSKKRDEIISRFCKEYDLPYVFESDFIMPPFAGNGIVELVHDKNNSAKKWFRQRWLNFSIDTFQDLDLIKAALSDYLRVINNTFRKAHGIKIPKGIHLRNAVRLIKVFDFRNTKPSTPYQSIALGLTNEGYYKGRTLSKSINSVKKDYAVIFR